MKDLGYGKITVDGKEYAYLEKEAHYDGSYENYTKNESYIQPLLGEDGNYYEMVWEIKYPDEELEEDACDWDDFTIVRADEYEYSDYYLNDIDVNEYAEELQEKEKEK